MIPSGKSGKAMRQKAELGCDVEQARRTECKETAI